MRHVVRRENGGKESEMLVPKSLPVQVRPPGSPEGPGSQGDRDPEHWAAELGVYHPLPNDTFY